VLGRDLKSIKAGFWRIGRIFSIFTGFYGFLCFFTVFYGFFREMTGNDEKSQEITKNIKK